jgi:thymidylate synthase (FAD)
MDTWRQWIRHRTASVNEYSTRYSEAIDEQHIPDANEFRKQTKLNRQGSGTMLSPQDGEQLRNETIELFGHVTKVYKNRLRFGVAREQAREVLPLSNYTEAYWKIDLHNLLNFLSLRMDSQAQEEIRLFANVIARIVQEWVPLTWNAFRDYRLEGMHLSKRDIDAIWLRKVDIDVVFRTLLKWSWIRKNHDPTAIPVYRLTKNRERDECERKLHRLDMSVPWANLRHAPKK